MKKLFFFFLFFPLLLPAQRLRYGIEAGYAGGGKTLWGHNGQARYEQRFSKSWLVGLHVQFRPGRLLYFDAGLQHQQRGTSITQEQTGTTANGIPYKSRHTDNSLFQKICFPLSAGFFFHYRSWTPSVFAGWRPNFIVSGRHVSSQIIDYASLSGPDLYSEQVYRPLKTSGPGIWLKTQWFYGLSVKYRERVQLSFSVNKGPGMAYTSHPVQREKSHCRNTDYVCSLTWFWWPVRCCGCYTRFGTIRFL